MDTYLVGVDGVLWTYGDNYRLVEVEVGLKFNPSSLPYRDNILTSEGTIYNIQANTAITLNSRITSFTGYGRVLFAVTEDRELVQIGDYVYDRNAQPDDERVFQANYRQVLREDCDYVARSDTGIMIIVGTDWGLVNMDGGHDVNIITRHNMPTVNDIIITRPGLIVTYDGVYLLTHNSVDKLPLNDAIIDAIHLPYQPQNHMNEEDNLIMAMNDRGNLFLYSTRIDGGSRVTQCDSLLVNDLNNRSKWYGFMDLRSPIHYDYRAIGIHNIDGTTYLINDAWMITDADVPIKFHLRDRTPMKNPRTAYDQDYSYY